MKTSGNIKIFIFFILIVKVSFSHCQNFGTVNSDNKTKQLLSKADSLLKTSNYEAAITTYIILSEHFKEKKQWEEVMKAYLQIAYSYQIRGIFDSSYYFLNISYELINDRALNDAHLLGTYYYLKGSTNTKTGELDSALQSLNFSLKYLREGVDDSLLVLVKRSLGNIHYSNGDYDLSLKYYEDALLKEKLRRNPSEIMLAALFQNIGIVKTTMGNYDSARVYLNKSIKLKEKTLGKTDPQLAIGYFNYGRFLFVMGYPDQALIFYTKAEEIYYSNFGMDYFGLAPIYYNKGSIYILLRDLNKALNYHERALELYLKSINQNNPIIGDINMNLGVIYEGKGDLSKAIHYYNESLKGNYNSESAIKSLKSLGGCFFKLNKNDEAEENYKLSITKSEIIFGVNHHITAGSYLAYGGYCISVKEYKKAEILLSKAYKIWIENFGKRNREVSLTLTYLGDLYRNMGDYDKALVYYQKAIISYNDNFNNENVNVNPTLKDIDPEFDKFVTLYKKAYTLYDIYNEKSKNTHYLEVSLETSKLSIALFESIMASYKDENTKIMTNEYVYDIYNLVVQIAGELYSRNSDPKYLNIAFEYSEKGKAAILLSSIRGFEAIEIGNIPINIKNLEESLKRDISLIKNFINDESQKSQPDSNKLVGWKKEIFAKTLSYDSLIGSIETQYPDYFNLKYNMDVVAIGEIQKNIENDEIFIEYKIIDSLLYTFSITKDIVKLNKEILESDFRGTVLSFISSINQFPSESFDKENYLEFIYRGNDLYRTLLYPYVQSDLIKKITIIPDNILGYLPFEALIKEYRVPEKIDFKNLVYALESYSISYAYSGTLLLKHFNQPVGGIKLLAMAPSYNINFESSKETFSGARDIFKNLNTLNYTIDEVKSIASLFNGMILTGEEATESNFKENADKYGILHFAMHTLINDEDPMASKLIFTLNNDSTEDGFLNAYEIYNLKLNAELAVLSACKTGMGKYSKGEGIMSLARGFLFAGVPSVVMTLWEVEDVSGSKIMYNFYKNLKSEMPTDEALRDAKLSYLKSSDPLQSHPYFWAAYVQIGKTKPIINFTYRRIFIISGSVLILVALLFYLKKTLLKRKKI